MTAPTLRATDAKEFLELLRGFAAASGRTRGTLLRHAKEYAKDLHASMPRSTFYWLLSERNTALPRNHAQVAAICKACKLSDEEVADMLTTWRTLAQGEHLGRDGAGVAR
ncbi:hypothetical protein [Nocardia sp. NPDC052566]|uniref:hypothetical protein n=1 Tax=Nocardia sp. NPDC052566 TaxID=3364330 RepID=UPI0037C64ECE